MHSKAIKIGGIFVAFAPIVWLMVRAVLCNPVFCDSGYYLSVMKRMAEGAHLYQEVGFGYMPLMPYLLLLTENSTGGLPYEGWLTLHMLLLTLSGGVLYHFTKVRTGSRTWGWVATWLYLWSVFAVQGDALLLEIPSLCCGLGALCLLQDKPTWWRFLAAGIGCALAFGFKQYGLGFLPLCLYVLWEQRNSCQRATSWCLFAVSYIAAIGLIFLLEPSCWQVIWPHYGHDAVAQARYGHLLPLRYVLPALKVVFTRAYPAILLVLIAIWKATRTQQTALLLPLGGLLGFVLQFYFSSGDHYFLYLFPFAACLAAQVGQMCYQQQRILWLGWCLIALLGISWVGSKTTPWTYSNRFKVRQNNLAQVIEDQVPSQASLLVFNANHFGLYFLTNRKPPMLQGKYCYSYGPLVLTEQLMLDKMAASDYILKVRKTSGWEIQETASITQQCALCDTLYQDKSVVLLHPNKHE